MLYVTNTGAELSELTINVQQNPNSARCLQLFLIIKIVVYTIDPFRKNTLVQ